MQEAFGGTFMLKLFMVFFVIYVAFIGVALNFAKIYRIKNNVINILEQYQYKGEKTSQTNDVYKNLDEYLNSIPYGYKDAQGTNYKQFCQNRASGTDKVDETMYKTYGVCVIQKGEDKKHYYNVTVYYVINFPILGDVLNIPITASGETTIID